RPPTSALFPYTTLFRSLPPRPTGGGSAVRASMARHRPRTGTTSSGPVTRSRTPAISNDVRTPRPEVAEHMPFMSGQIVVLPGSRSEEHTSELQSRENLV